MDTEKVKELVQLLKDEDLKVLTVKDGDMEVHIEANIGETAPVPETPAKAEGGKEKEPDSGLHEIRAAQVGTFYTEKDENSDETFVEAGDEVSEGDQVGMIEAMKVFNDVVSDVSGTVEEILVENGENVEYDQPLITIRPKEG